MKRLSVVLFSAAVVFACSAPPVPTTDAGMLAGTPVPGFSLTDVNPASSTRGQALSLGSFAGKVTGWYFGHSS
jgi:hypothetical protein